MGVIAGQLVSIVPRPLLGEQGAVAWCQDNLPSIGLKALATARVLHDQSQLLVPFRWGGMEHFL